MQAEPRRPLPEGYYVDNFVALLDQVTARYGDLLTPEERSLRHRFVALPVAAQRLYVRLAARRGPAFRRDRLAYREIPRLDEAIAALEGAALCDRGDDQDLLERVDLLLRPELADLCRQLLPPTSVAATTKAELRRRLAEETCPAALQLALGRFEVVRLLDLELVTLYQLLFFGNFEQSLTEFVLRDLGVVVFEGYSLDPELRRFPERAALDDALELHALRLHLEELLAADDLAAAEGLGRAVAARADAWHRSCERAVDSLLLAAGRALDRAGCWDSALELLAPVRRPPGRERCARLLHRLQRDDQALELCAAMIDGPRDETENAFGDFFAHRIQRRQGLVAPRPRPRRTFEELALPAPAPSDGDAIEARVLEHFASLGRPGFFAENWLWRSLYGLAFWDIVFAPVAGAFEHPFQYGPLDLSLPDFRQAREDLITTRLAHLEAHREAGSLRRELLAVYAAKHGIANRLVAWHEELLPALELALEHLTGPQLAAVCDRLSRGLRRYGRGLPDLFVVRDDATGFHLIEVKGPGDGLRPEQGRWIDYLRRKGLQTILLRVAWHPETPCYDASEALSSRP